MVYRSGKPRLKRILPTCQSSASWHSQLIEMLSAEHSRRKAGTTRQLRELPAAKNLEASGLNVSAHPPQLLDHRYGRWGVSSPGGEKVKRG